MCGICGSFAIRSDATVDPSRVRAMAAALRHRGPDDDGFYDGDGITLGFRRLAILDLSPAGNQPHRAVRPSAGDEVVSVLNGEIYNYRDLRRDLESKGISLRSSGDSEVVPHLYLEYGDAFLERMHGMFALALFDRRRGRLLLARDRLGKKPLYLHERDGRVDFASEVKALLAPGDVAVTPCRAALSQFLVHGVVPGTGSAFSGLRRVAPGQVIEFTARGMHEWCYWRPPHEVAPAHRSLADWKGAVFDALVTAVRRRLQSDVPVGVFLSGGIDSGLILAAARRATDGELRAFTIGFDDARFDERALAAATARHLGVQAEVAVATPVAEDAIRAITATYDEPFGDSSAYPTLLVSQLAAERVRVALAGDGGDETFAGYQRHRAVLLAERVARVVPAPLRRGLAAWIGEAANGTAGRSRVGQLRRFAAALGRSSAERNAYWSTFFRGPVRRSFLHDDLLAEAPEADGLADRASDESPLRRALYRDLTTYLPDDLLVKTDLASMAHSLEVRAPFLDHELVELAAAIPEPMLVQGAVTKRLLRELAKDHLPPAVATARKRGFGVPLADWLRGPLAAVVDDHLLGERFAGRRLLKPGAAAELVSRHRSRREDWSSYLWLLLIGESWFRRHVDREP